MADATSSDLHDQGLGPFSLAAAVDALDVLAPHRGDGGAYEGWHVIGHRPLSIRVRQAGPAAWC